MKTLFTLLILSFALSAQARNNNDDQDNLDPAYSRPFNDNQGGSYQYQPGQPVINTYGQPVRIVPADGGGGVPLGPINPNAYGPGMGSDATGRPVKAVPW